MKKLMSILSLLCLFSISLPAFEYKNGDLIFQAQGTSNFSDAIATATGMTDSLTYVHVGIVFKDNSQNINVIEASPEKGVRILPVDCFINLSPKYHGKPYLTLKRVNKEIPVEQIIENAMKFLGQPYDWYYMPDNGMIYCSELVYESYLDINGNKIFQAKPMNFRSPDGTMPDFWIELYKKLGVEVPEGIPGTNPNDLSNDPQLIEVYRFF